MVFSSLRAHLRVFMHAFCSFFLVLVFLSFLFYLNIHPCRSFSKQSNTVYLPVTLFRSQNRLYPLQLFSFAPYLSFSLSFLSTLPFYP